MKLSTGVSPASAERLNRACDRVCYRASESDLEKVSSPSDVPGHQFVVSPSGQIRESTHQLASLHVEAPMEQLKDQIIKILKADSWGQCIGSVPQPASTIEDVATEMVQKKSQAASEMHVKINATEPKAQQLLLERQDMEQVVNQTRVEEMTLEQNISMIKQLVQMKEEQQSLKCELDTEIKCRERLAQEVKGESLKRDKLSEEMQQMAKNRTGVENEIVASIRQVMEQSEAFREAVCQEAVEQRTVLAREITSGLEATLDQRIADLHAVTSGLEATLDQRVGVLRQVVEETTTILTKRCDTHEQSLEHLIQRCNTNASSEMLRASVQADHAAVSKQMAVFVEELQQNIAEARRYTDGIGGRCSDIEQRVSSIERRLSEDSTRKSQDMYVAVANLAEEVKEEVTERTLLGRRLHAESTNISAAWSEIENVQQQVAELRESLWLDVQSQLIQQKQASEDRMSSLIASLQSWQDKSIQSFEKHKNDVSALREQMTEHLSWVAKDHESEVAHVKTQVLSIAEQTKEISAKLSHLQECERNRANDTSVAPRSNDTSIIRQSTAPQVSGIRSSGGSQPPTSRLRPVSPGPMRNMPSPPPPSNTSYAAPSNSMIVDASAPISAVVGRNLPKPPEVGSNISQGGLQRTPSAGLLSARFSGGPSRNPR